MNTPKYQMMRAVHWDTDEIRGLSTEEIVQKLKNFGVDFKKDHFLRDTQRYLSASDLADHWRKIYQITARGFDEDFIWMACIVLWERLAPSIINSEQIDDKMQDGYDLSHQGKHSEACGLWLEVWEHLKGRFTKEMKSIYDVERVFNGMQLLSNWCQDFEDELMMAAEEDPVFHKQRLQYCKEFCGFFPQTGGCIIQNMQSAMEESSRILKNIIPANSGISPDPVNIQNILGPLEFIKEGKFPKDAVLKAMKHREAVTPALLEILRKANTNAKTLLKQDTYMAHMYALYLLAYFRENQAYPIIVDFFSMPGDISLDLTGDVVTEDLDRILASVSCGDTGLMQMLVENEKANEYVRNAALRGITTLVACGEKTRDEVISYFKKLYQGGLERRPSCVWSALIDCSMDLYPKEVCDDINNAYAEDLVESFFFARRDADRLQKVLASNPEEILSKLKGNPRYSLIKDPVSEMETWGCFEQPKKKWNSSDRNQKIDTSGFVATPVRNENKVGRNEPCPCGSGKKYKKCCLK